MWPFGGILNAIQKELLVPGQDSPATFAAFASWPNTATSGVYMNRTTGGALANGSLAERDNSSYIPKTNMWIHSDFRPYVDPTDYEFRYVGVTGQTGNLLGSPWAAPGTFGADDYWQSGELNPNWRVTASGPEFGSDRNIVTGTIQVREKADTSNIRSGILTLDAWYEGLS